MFRLPLYLQIWQQSLDECVNTLDKTMLLTSFLYFHFCITTFWLDIHEPPVDNSRPQRGNGTSCYFAAEEGRKPSGPMHGCHMVYKDPNCHQLDQRRRFGLAAPCSDSGAARSKEKPRKAQLAKYILRTLTVLRTNLPGNRPGQLSASQVCGQVGLF